MKKLTLLMSLGAFMFTSIASAHGPVRQKLEQEITINAPAAKVWNIIKEYNDLSWLPVVKGVTATGGNEKGAVRTLTLKNGGTIVEELKKYDAAKMSYDYKITDISTTHTIVHSGVEEKVPVFPVDNYAASIKIEDKGGSSVVSWKTGYYRAYMNNNPPAEMNEEAANTAVGAVLKEGLENLKTLAEK
jgi:mxaD protein